MNILLDYGLVGVGIILLVIMSIIGVFAIKLIKSLLAKVGVDLREEQLSSLQNIASKVVKTLNQTMTDKFKYLNPNGKLTAAQKKKIYREAFSMLATSMDSGQYKALIEQYGDYESGVKIVLESAVADAKNEKPQTINLDSCIDDILADEDDENDEDDDIEWIDELEDDDIENEDNVIDTDESLIGEDDDGFSVPDDCDDVEFVDIDDEDDSSDNNDEE